MSLEELDAAIAGLEDLSLPSPNGDDDIPPPPPPLTSSTSSSSLSSPTLSRGVPILPPPLTVSGLVESASSSSLSSYLQTSPTLGQSSVAHVALPAKQNSMFFYDISSAENSSNNNLYEGAAPSARPAFSPMNTQYIPYTATVAQSRTPVKPVGGLPPPPTAQMPTLAKRIVEVVTSDGSLSKKLEVSDDMTGMDLLNKFASKSRLQDSGYFSLAVQERGFFRWINLNGLLRAQDVPSKIVIKLQFIKTPKIFRDPVAIQLYWMQINEMIITGLYPVSDYLTVKLAALSVQAKYGNFDPTVHKIGFFQIPGNELKNFLPNTHAQKYKSEYWERRLFAQHARYFGMDELQSRLEYIRVARKSPSYGSSLFEVMSGAYALVGAAEDGILLSKLRNSKCGDWTFYSFDKLLSFKKSGYGLEFSAFDNNKQMQTIKLGLQDKIVDAAYDCILDYHALFKMKTDPSFSPPSDRFLPPLDAYEDFPKRTMLADFPSRLEFFKECYIKATGASRPLLFILEQIDYNLDLGRDCDLLNFNNSSLEPESWQFIRNALLETFSFKPTGPQVFVENFNCKTLRMAQNPRLGAESFVLMVPVVAAGFPLIHLDLSANGFEDEKAVKSVAEVILQCRTLNSVVLKDNRFGSKNAVHLLKSFKENGAIRTVDLSGCDLRDPFCFPLALVVSNHPSLQEIDLSNNAIGDDGLAKINEGLKRSKSMTKLNLSNTKVRSHAVKPLIDVASSLGRVKSLTLTSCKLSEKTAIKIATLLALRGPAGVLRHLDIQQTDLTKKGTLAIFQAMELNQTLETLIIGGNEIERVGLAALAKGLRTNNTLKTLSLKGSSLSPDSYPEIANIIRGTTSLTDLDLSSMALGPGELKKVTDAIIFNRTISTLNISSNPKITVEGVTSLMAPFLNNANLILTKLFLDGCNIGDEGAKKLADMLTKNTSIARLSIKENNISSEGAHAIFKALVINKSLSFLNIDKNDIPWHNDQKVCEARNAVTMNRSIVWDGRRSS